MDNKRLEGKTSNCALIAHIIVSVLYVTLGVVMLLCNTDIISTIVYSFLVITIGILFIGFGAFHMIKYFFNQEFKKVSNYGFTQGVILVIIGAVLIFKAADISNYIDIIVCLITVVLGAIMLQQAFALFHIEVSAWIVSLILGIGTIGVSIYFLINQLVFFKGELLSCIFLIVIGAISLINLLIMTLALRDFRKKDSNTVLNDAEIPVEINSLDDSCFENEDINEAIQVESIYEQPADSSTEE